MARKKKTGYNPKRHDPGFSTPPPDVQLTTAAIGSPATNLVLSFAQPMMIVGTGIPMGITVGTLAPTSVVGTGPNAVTLGFASTLATGTTLNVLSSIPNYRTPAGGYLLPTRRTL